MLKHLRVIDMSFVFHSYNEYQILQYTNGELLILHDSIILVTLTFEEYNLVSPSRPVHQNLG